jgi:hypothetical protein
MAIEYAIASTAKPWLDNWAFVHQLWLNEGVVGGELNLTPSSRLLTLRIKDSNNDVVLLNNEMQSSPAIALVHQQRGVVEIRLKGDHWKLLKPETQYSAEILAYGIVKKTFTLDTTPPEPQEINVNGVEVYGSPSGIQALLGDIPGADTETSVDLSSGWSLNAQGYWVKPVEGIIYGLWVNGHYAEGVEYRELAITADRAWAQVGNTIYYKGSETLTPQGCPFGIESAYSPMVLKSLMTATAEINRETGRSFSRKRIIRETHRVTRNQDQLFPRHTPVAKDQYFRISNYSQGRSVQRFYRQADLDRSIHLDSKTGVITLQQSYWDFDDSFNGFNVGSSFTPGENSTEITYTGGPVVPPFDIDDAANSLAAVRLGRYWQQAMSQGLDAVSIGCVNLNFGEMTSRWFPAWQQSAQDAIAAHKILDFDNI